VKVIKGELVQLVHFGLQVECASPIICSRDGAIAYAR